jgi:hypothetical protein
MVESRGITIGLHPTNKKKPGSGSVSIGFMVDSLDETMAMLEKNKITCRFEDGKSGKYIHFDDPDGTCSNAMCHVPNPKFYYGTSQVPCVNCQMPKFKSQLSTVKCQMPTAMSQISWRLRLETWDLNRCHKLVSLTGLSGLIRYLHNISGIKTL